MGATLLPDEAPRAPLPPGVTPDERKRQVIMDSILEQLLDAISHDDENFSHIRTASNESTQRKLISSLTEKAFDHLNIPDGFFLTRPLRQELMERIFHEMYGFGPIQPLILDATISEIMVNGPTKVFIEREGLIAPVDVHFRSHQHLTNIIERIVWRLGRHIDEASPMVDARLPDGSRVNAAIHPVALGGPYLTIRKFPSRPVTMESLIRRHSLNHEMANFLALAVAARLNILVSGGTSSGKTTLLNVLASLTPPQERIITIEDAAELRFADNHDNICSFEARPPNVEGRGAITIRHLIKNALRMRPDRLIVGEVRGPEALDMLQAMNTGHEGSFTTVHANSAQDLFSRLETMVCMAATELPVSTIRDIIASAIHLVVHVSRLQDGSRKITEIVEVDGIGADGRILRRPIWTLGAASATTENGVQRAFVFHDIPSATRSRLEMKGYRTRASTRSKQENQTDDSKQGTVTHVLGRMREDS